MRIVAIRGSNLASLKGDFAVELDQPPLSSLGLFAIHGPVGAGKSTLLDALTLALFGRTPRLSGSGGAVLVRGDDDVDQLRANDPATLVRRGASSAHAEVDFIGHDGRLYRARWDIRRGRGVKGRPGRLQDVKQSLKDVVNDAVLGDGNGEVRRLIEERLGLSFDELCRSVLLAQGGFQGFLSAKPAERAELLEKVTGTGIYSRLGEAAFERARSVEQQLKTLEARVDGAIVLDDGARAALQAEVVLQGSAAANADARALALGHALERAQATRAWRDAVAAERDAVTAARDAAARDADSRTRHDEARRRLDEIAPALAEHARSLARCAGPRARLDEATGTARARDAASAAAQARLTDAGATLTDALARRDAARREADAALAGLGVVVDAAVGDDVAGQLQARLMALRALREARDACDGAEAIVAAAADDVARAALDVEQATAARAAAHDAARALLPAGVPIEAHGDAIAVVAVAVRDAIAAALATVEATITAREGVVRRLEEALQARATRRALQEARAALRDGEPCPVCGSGSHPALSHGPTSPDDGHDEVDAVVVAERDALRALYEERAGHRARLAAVTSRAVAGRVIALAIPASLEERLALLGRLDDAAGAVRRVVDADVHLARAIAAEDAASTAHAAQVLQRDALGARFAAARAALQAPDDDVADDDGALRARLTALRQAIEGWGQARRIVATRDADVARAELALQTARHDVDAADAAAHASHAVCAAHAEAVRAAEDEFARARAALRTLGVADDVDAFAAALRADVDAAAGAHAVASAAARAADVAVAAARQRVVERSERLERFGGPDERDDVDAAGLPAQIEAARAEAARARDAAAAARARLAHDEATCAERARLAAEVERSRAEGEVWRSLSSLIGSADGSRFRQFAQGLTLDALVAHANEHLQVLAPRYRLRRTKSEQQKHDLDLVVIDTEGGGDVRSTQTLSGGESFLVSLALALGLSSLSANEGARGRVESLFIDEGFSALDQETLDVALSAFDALRQTGRQIGVISHVPLLVERLGAQVRVVPIGGGASRVEIHAA